MEKHNLLNKRRQRDGPGTVRVIVKNVKAAINGSNLGAPGKGECEDIVMYCDGCFEQKMAASPGAEN